MTYEVLDSEPKPKVVPIEVRQFGLRTGQIVMVRRNHGN